MGTSHLWNVPGPENKTDTSPWQPTPLPVLYRGGSHRGPQRVGDLPRVTQPSSRGRTGTQAPDTRICGGNPPPPPRSNSMCDEPPQARMLSCHLKDHRLDLGP